MEFIEMKTGRGEVNELTDNLRTFVLVFMSVIWRRVWITTTIYCEHNGLELNKDIILKCLKYNIMSDTGIGNTLKPYIKVAFKDGFIMPSLYRKNLYATRAIMMYKDAYEIVKKHDPNLETEFIKDYALSIFKLEPKQVSESASEIQDTIKEANQLDSDTDSDKSQSEMDKCNCRLCDLINAWDINMSLVYSDDPFQNIIMTGLMTIAN